MRMPTIQRIAAIRSRNNMPRPQSTGLIGWFLSSLAFFAAVTTPLCAATAELIRSSEPGWPQFRGPRRDGISDERNLLQAWPEAGPALAWRAQGIGRGFSSPVIADGRLFITGDV